MVLQSFGVQFCQLLTLDGKQFFEAVGVEQGDRLTEVVLTETGVNDVNVFQIHAFLELQRKII